MSEQEAERLKMAAMMEHSAARGLALGVSAKWLALKGDPDAGVAVAGELLTFWKGVGEQDPGEAIWRMEAADAVVCMAQGFQRAGDLAGVVRVRDHYSDLLQEFGFQDRAAHVAIITADTHLDADEVEAARALLPGARPDTVIVASAWDRVRGRLDEIDRAARGDTQSIAERWTIAVGKVELLLKIMVSGMPGGEMLAGPLEAKMAQERNRVPATEEELAARLLSLSETLGKM